MSNSPHPSSSILNGGFLNAGHITIYQPDCFAEQRAGGGGERHCAQAHLPRTLVRAGLETRMQFVEHLVEDGGGHVFAAVVDQEDGDVPFSQREAFHAGGFLSRGARQSRGLRVSGARAFRAFLEERGESYIWFCSVTSLITRLTCDEKC